MRWTCTDHPKFRVQKCHWEYTPCPLRRGTNTQLKPTSKAPYSAVQLSQYPNHRNPATLHITARANETSLRETRFTPLKKIFLNSFILSRPRWFHCAAFVVSLWEEYIPLLLSNISPPEQYHNLFPVRPNMSHLMYARQLRPLIQCLTWYLRSHYHQKYELTLYLL